MTGNAGARYVSNTGDDAESKKIDCCHRAGRYITAVKMNPITDINLVMQAADAATEFGTAHYKDAPMTDRHLASNSFAAGFAAGVIWREKTLNIRTWRQNDTRELTLPRATTLS